MLVTPWFMNLVCLPGPGDDWDGLAAGSEFSRRLPAGEIGFVAAREAGVGSYLACSLFSPMDGFRDMAAARAVAQAAMRELFEAPAGLSEKLARPVSRRSFLSALLPPRSSS